MNRRQEGKQGRSVWSMAAIAVGLVLVAIVGLMLVIGVLGVFLFGAAGPEPQVVGEVAVEANGRDLIAELFEAFGTTSKADIDPLYDDDAVGGRSPEFDEFLRSPRSEPETFERHDDGSYEARYFDGRSGSCVVAMWDADGFELVEELRRGC